MAEIRTQGHQVNVLPTVAPVDPTLLAFNPSNITSGIQDAFGVVQDRRILSEDKQTRDNRIKATNAANELRAAQEKATLASLEAREDLAAKQRLIDQAELEKNIKLQGLQHDIEQRDAENAVRDYDANQAAAARAAFIKSQTELAGIDLTDAQVRKLGAEADKIEFDMNPANVTDATDNAAWTKMIGEVAATTGVRAEVISALYAEGTPDSRNIAQKLAHNHVLRQNPSYGQMSDRLIGLTKEDFAHIDAIAASVGVPASRAAEVPTPPPALEAKATIGPNGDIEISTPKEWEAAAGEAIRKTAESVESVEAAEAAEVDAPDSESDNAPPDPPQTQDSVIPRPAASEGSPGMDITGGTLGLLGGAFAAKKISDNASKIKSAAGAARSKARAAARLAPRAIPKILAAAGTGARRALTGIPAVAAAAAAYEADRSVGKFLSGRYGVEPMTILQAVSLALTADSYQDQLKAAKFDGLMQRVDLTRDSTLLTEEKKRMELQKLFSQIKAINLVPEVETAPNRKGRTR